MYSSGVLVKRKEIRTNNFTFNAMFNKSQNYWNLQLLTPSQ